MRKIDKYENLCQELPKLQGVLCDSLQCETLNIKKIDHSCKKFATCKASHPILDKAAYVIYSPYVRRADHKFEKFIFIDALGETLCHVGGDELDLHGMIADCLNLKINEEYKYAEKG